MKQNSAAAITKQKDMVPIIKDNIIKANIFALITLPLLLIGTYILSKPLESTIMILINTTSIIEFNIVITKLDSRIYAR